MSWIRGLSLLQELGFCWKLVALAAITVSAWTSGLVVSPAYACSLILEEEVAGEGSTTTGTWLLRVEVEPGLADAELYPGWIHNRNPSIVEQFPEVPGHEQWISIVLKGEIYDYQVRVIAMRDGEPVGLVQEMMPCACTNEEVMKLIDGGISVALEQLRALAARERTLSEIVSVEPTRRRGRRIRRSKRDASARWLGWLGYSGIGLGVFGVAGIAAGIPLMLRPPELAFVGGEPRKRSTRPVGVASTVIGGVAFAAGIAMITVDAVRRRSRRLSVVPSVSRRFAGVSVGLEI